MDDNPEIRECQQINISQQTTSWTLYLLHITSLKYPIYDTFLLLIGYAKKSLLKVLQNSFLPLWFPVNKCFTATLTHAQMLPLAGECCRHMKPSMYIVIFGNICYENPSRGMKSQLELLFCGHETQTWLDSRLTKCFAHGLWLTSARIWPMKMTKLTVFIALSLQCVCCLCVLCPWHMKICKDGK